MPNLPNILTLSRIVLLPVVIALLYMERIMGAEAAWMAFALYVIVALTDFLDGWLARKFKTTSAFGAFFDPIADKIFVGALLVAFAGFGRLPGLWLIPAIIIIAREFLVSGLREYLAPLGVQMPVTPLAKWKTATQMISTGFLIVGPHLPGALLFGQLMLTFAAILTLITGREYLKAGLDHMKKMP